MQPIRNVVAIIPVWREPVGMIQKFVYEMEAVGRELAEAGVGFRFYFLDDGSPTFSEKLGRLLVLHRENQQLARTLVDGYEAISERVKERPDLVVRIDCQEHNPKKIHEIVEHCSTTDVDAVFLPVCYWQHGQPRPPMWQTTDTITRFRAALSPMEPAVLEAVYNQVFPLGYQAWRTDCLEELLPDLRRSLELFWEHTRETPSWGLDLLAILLAAHRDPERIDFLFGGWVEPWLENRPPEKIAAQQARARMMIEVARRLGCT